MSQSDLLDYIEQAVRQRYGNLAAPDFHFVAEALERTPLRAVAREMQAQGLRVTEDTDPNGDVALGYVIENEHERLFLQISIVAPFAQLRRVLADHGTELIASESECRSALEHQVWSTLLKHRVRPLDRATLLAPLALELPNTAAGEATVYNALFSDDEANL